MSATVNLIIRRNNDLRQLRNDGVAWAAIRRIRLGLDWIVCCKH